MIKLFSKTWLVTLLLLCGTGLSGYAQNNPYANPYASGIVPAKSPIAVGETTVVTMTLGNNGASPIPAGGATFNISFTKDIEPDLSSFNLDGGPFTVTSFEDEGITYVQLTVSGAGIPAKTSPLVKTSYTITINVKGKSVGGPTDMILNALPEPSIAQNLNPGDDNATAPFQVTQALPVTLASFTAKKEGAGALLNWVTLQERNTKSFVVEHSLDGRSWKSIASVAAVGNSTTEQRYSHLDTDPANGLNYYRLRMVDFDGHTELSRSQSLSFERGMQANVYPNPAVDYLTLDVKDASKVQQVQILSSTGGAVYESATPATQVKVSNLTKGLYLVRFQFKNGSTETYKVIKQ